MNTLLNVFSENFPYGNLVLLLNFPNRNVCISQKSKHTFSSKKALEIFMWTEENFHAGENLPLHSFKN